MLPTAGQTAGSNGLTFFVDTHGCYRLKKSIFFFKLKKFISLKFFPTGNTGTFSLFYIYIYEHCLPISITTAFLNTVGG